MASRAYGTIGVRGNHEIGTLNSKWAKHMVNGAMATEDIDNYLLVELERNEDGDLTCKALTDTTTKGYLATTIEEEDLMQTDGFNEEYVDFFNGEDEMVRITDVDVQKNVRFETSAFSKNAGGEGEGTEVTEVKRGMVAHFDPNTKKYIVSLASDTASAYDTAANKFEVVGVDTDFGYAFDKETIRLMSI